jgi:RHS repeat-associated protein
LDKSDGIKESNMAGIGMIKALMRGMRVVHEGVKHLQGLTRRVRECLNARIYLGCLNHLPRTLLSVLTVFLVMSGSGHAQQSTIPTGVQITGGCIQFDPKGTRDCSPTPNEITVRWVLSPFGSGATVSEAIAGYIAAVKRDCPSCSVSLSPPAMSIYSKSEFEFRNLVTSKVGYANASVCVPQNDGTTRCSSPSVTFFEQFEARCAPPYDYYNLAVELFNPTTGGRELLTRACYRNLEQADRRPPEPESCRRAPSLQVGVGGGLDGERTPYPIIPATGEKQLIETDFIDSGSHPLTWQRTYRSLVQVASVGRAPLLDSQWHVAGVGGNLTYRPATAVPPRGVNDAPTRIYGTATHYINEVQLFDSQGISRIFRDSVEAPHTWSAQGSVQQLQTLWVGTSTIAGFRLTDESKSVYEYSANGQLVSQISRNGLRRSFGYNAAGQLTRITNHFGRSIDLAYGSNGQLASLSTPDSRLIRYEYDSTNRLTRVTYPDNTSRLYHYENPSLTHLLTGVTDENNVRLATYAYNAEGKAIESVHAGGVNRYGVTYPASAGATTQVTDPLGTNRSYTYSNWLGQLLVTKASAPGNQGGMDMASHTYSQGLYYGSSDFKGASGPDQLEWNLSLRLPTRVLRYNHSDEQIGWDASTRLPTIITSTYLITRLSYDLQGNLLARSEFDRTTSLSGAPQTTRTWAWSYNTASQVITSTDSRGFVTQYAYDATGNLSRITNPLGHITRMTHDAAGRVLTLTEPNGLITSYGYDARDRITQIIRGVNLAVTEQHKTVYTYKPNGRLATASLPSGHLISYAYDNAQRLIGMSDNRGNRVDYTLDNIGNRVNEVVKDASNQIALSTQRVINALNRVQSVTTGIAPYSTTMRYGFDANGEEISQTNGVDAIRQQILDIRRRVTQVTEPDGSFARIFGWQGDHVNSVDDYRRIQTNYFRNGWGEIVREQNIDIGSNFGSVVPHYYIRDAAGNILTKKDAKNQTTSYEYDALNRVTKITYADAKTEQFSYDSGTNMTGYLASFTDRSGSTSYTRDPFGRILSKTQSVNDNASNPTSLALTHLYNSAGQLTELRYPSGLRVLYARDATGRVSAISTKTSASAAAKPFIASLAYTALGQPQSWAWQHCTTATSVLNSCAASQRAYDSAGRMSTSEIASYQYDAAGRITGLTQILTTQKSVASGSGTATITVYEPLTMSWTLSYDNRDRLTAMSRVDASAQASSQYTYDANSNRLSSLQQNLVDTNKDGNLGFGSSTDTRSNTSQALTIATGSNKLLGFNQSITSTRKTSNTATTATLSTTLSTVTYQLDANGNLTSDGLRDYQYDAADRLAKTILGTTFVGTDTIAGNELARHSYLHNAQGQRVFKSEPQTEQTAPSETTLGTGFVDWLRTNFSWLWATAQTDATLGDSYLYAEEGSSIPSWALLGEYGNGGANSTGRTEYLWLPTDAGGQANPAIPVGLFRGGQFYSLQTDHLGTPRLMKDRNNIAVWQWPYSAFGDNAPTGTLRTSTSPNSAIVTQNNGAGITPTYWVTSSASQRLNLRFPGQYFDSESNLHYNYFRNYQPTQGRYTQNDPIGLSGGWNRFGYVGGDAVSRTDPEGLQANRPDWWNDLWKPKTPPGNCATAECAAGVLPKKEPKATPEQCFATCFAAKTGSGLLLGAGTGYAATQIGPRVGATVNAVMNSEISILASELVGIEYCHRICKFPKPADMCNMPQISEILAP